MVPDAFMETHYNIRVYNPEFRVTVGTVVHTSTHKLQKVTDQGEAY